MVHVLRGQEVRIHFNGLLKSMLAFLFFYFAGFAAQCEQEAGCLHHFSKPNTSGENLVVTELFITNTSFNRQTALLQYIHSKVVSV